MRGKLRAEFYEIEEKDCGCMAENAANCAAAVSGSPVEYVMACDECECRCHYERDDD